MDAAAPRSLNGRPRSADIAAASQALREGRERALRRVRRRSIGRWVALAVLTALAVPGLVVYLTGGV